MNPQRPSMEYSDGVNVSMMGLHEALADEGSYSRVAAFIPQWLVKWVPKAVLRLPIHKLKPRRIFYLPAVPDSEVVALTPFQRWLPALRPKPKRTKRRRPIPLLGEVLRTAIYQLPAPQRLQLPAATEPKTPTLWQRIWAILNMDVVELWRLIRSRRKD